MPAPETWTAWADIAAAESAAPDDTVIVSGDSLATVEQIRTMPVFATEAARDAAIASPVAGMMVVITATLTLQFHDGTHWQSVVSNF